MKSILTKFQSWSGYDACIGIAPWIALMLAYYLLLFYYDHVITSFDRTVTGLETGTIYLLEIGQQGCVGDIVSFKSKKSGPSYLRRISAGPGQEFRLTPTGYEINGHPIRMDPSWVEFASAALKTKSSLKVPAGQLLVVNTEFSSKSRFADKKESDKWAFKLIEPKQIETRVTHILFSRDLSKISDPVNRQRDICLT